MNMQIKNINGRRELLNRPDGPETLMALYGDIALKKVTIPEKILNTSAVSFRSEVAKFRAQNLQAYAEVEEGFKRDS